MRLSLRASRAVRLAAFAVWLAVLGVGPALSALGEAPWPHWSMYKNYASGLCVIDAFEKQGDESTRIDRLDVLGFAGHHENAPARLRRAANFDEAKAIVQATCNKHGAPLFVTVRCQRGEGWPELVAADHDACAPDGLGRPAHSNPRAKKALSPDDTGEAGATEGAP
ncbi:MAG TPA: hypothetical protein VGO62_05215 [Myxococcota bacterium]|jgi:hypothetical protein